MPYPFSDLTKNWRQFTLLVVINAFVGGMIGLERSILPQLAEVEFGVTSKTAALSFITAFGLTKAVTNYFTGRWANWIGRRNLLLIGWVLALPVPYMLIYAQSWDWVVLANSLLGVHQGMAWSSTVVMKIDLAGYQNRGFAMGINEFAGYLAVGILSFLTAWLAGRYGVRPVPFYLGIALSVAGLLLTALFVRDTRHYVTHETEHSFLPLSSSIFLDTTFRHRILGAVTQAGLINNLNDGMIWGLLPLLLLSRSIELNQIGFLTAVYPTVWGCAQLITGKVADHYPKRMLLFWGMFIQSVAILMLLTAQTFSHFAGLGVMLGVGTALVYPTFMTTVAEYTNPAQRAESLGIFRFWRDSGYAIGALLTGLLADYWNISVAIGSIGLITGLSAFFLLVRIR